MPLVRSRLWLVAAALCASGGLMATVALAADGQLDPSFDGDGRVISDLTPLNDNANDLVIDGEGRIVVVGTLYDPNVEVPSRVIVARYNPDGSLDKGFSEDGWTPIAWTAGPETAGGIAIDSVGRIVVGGATVDGPDGWNFAAARLLSTGTPDSTFSTDGKVTVNVQGAGDDHGYAVATDAQDRVLVAGGATTVLPMPVEHVGIVRLDAKGVPDLSFDGDGSVLTDFPGKTFAFASAIQVDDHGRPVVAGSTAAGEATEFAAARYGDSGSLDASFDGDGRATLDFGSAAEEGASDLALDAVGRVVLVGGAGSSGKYVTDVGRLLENGSPDTGFDGDGRTITSLAQEAILAKRVAIDPAGRIVVAGVTETNLSRDAAVLRYAPDGVLDPSFGSGGVVREDFLAPGAAGEAIGVDAEGRYVLAGTATGEGGGQSFGLARFLASYPKPESAQAAESRCKGRVATLVGTARRDRLKGTKRRDVIAALGGNDLVTSLGGNDLVCAGAGKDVVKAGSGKDEVHGEAGNDRLFGQGGKDRLFGEKGKDLLAGGASRDLLRGGAGRDIQRP